MIVIAAGEGGGSGGLLKLEEESDDGGIAAPAEAGEITTLSAYECHLIVIFIAAVGPHRAGADVLTGACAGLGKRVARRARCSPHHRAGWLEGGGGP